MKLGIFPEFIKDHDIICLSETKANSLDNDYISDFQILTKAKSKGLTFGGCHGIALLHKIQHSLVVEELLGESLFVLWAKVSKNDFQFIIGATHIPNESSKYLDPNCFDSISLDVINLKSKYGFPIVIMGDLNARKKTTQTLHVSMM